MPVYTYTGNVDPSNLSRELRTRGIKVPMGKSVLLPEEEAAELSSRVVLELDPDAIPVNPSEDGLPAGGSVGEVLTNTAPGEGDWAPVQVQWARWQGDFVVAASPSGGATLKFIPLLNAELGNFQSDTTGGWSVDAEGRLVVPDAPAIVQIVGGISFDSGVDSTYLIGLAAYTSEGGGNLSSYQILTDSWNHDFSGFAFVGADGKVELNFRQSPWNEVAPAGSIELFVTRLPGSADWQDVV